MEFALILPLFLLLVFGAIDFAILFNQQLVLNNAVRQGARQSVVSGSTAGRSCSGIVSAVDSGVSSGFAMKTSSVTVKTTMLSGATPCGTGVDSTDSTTMPCTNSLNASTGVADSVVVVASYPTKLLVGLPVPGFNGTFTLQAKAVYQCEFS